MTLPAASDTVQLRTSESLARDIERTCLRPHGARLAGPVPGERPPTYLIALTASDTELLALSRSADPRGGREPRAA